MAGAADASTANDFDCLRLLYEHTDLGIFQITPAGEVVGVNRACARMFGYEDPAQAQREVHSVGDQHYVDPRQRAEILGRAVKQGGMCDGEIRYRRRDGSEFLGAVKTQAMRDERGEVRYFFGFVEDITERRAAERALCLSESRYRTLFETSTDAILMETTAGRILEANEAARRLFGYDRTQWPGLDAEQLVAPHERQRVRNIIAAEPPPRTRLIEMEALRADGTTFMAEVRSWRTELDGAPLLYVYVRDVSERKRLEARLQQSLKMEALGRLAGGVAHDFNNILTAIMGNAELLQCHLADALERHEAGRNALTQILDAGQRAAALTRQLLTFSRGSLVPPPLLEPGRAAFDMQRLLCDLLPANVKLTLLCDDDLRRVRLEPSQFEQVLMNLVVNARDALGEGGGEIGVSLTNREIDGVAAAGHDDPQPGSYVEIIVRDDGCGMDEDTRQRIFEPFFTTKRLGRGAGIGLALVHGIARHAGGHICVESAPGAGATFRVYLPAVLSETASDS